MSEAERQRKWATEAMAEMQRLATGQPLASIEEPERQPLSDKGQQQILAMTFKSSSEDVPHVVTLGPDGLVRCTCKAMLSIEYRPIGCWAMTDFRRVAGIHQP